MKKIITIVSVMMFLSMTISAGISSVEILKQIDNVESYKSSYSEMEQIITTSSGSKRVLKIRGWAVNNGDKQLSEYLAPADIEGQRILMTDDGNNIWMYNPETRRVRKLGSHMKKRKVMGSDFTYEDQSMFNMNKKFKSNNVSVVNFQGEECYLLDLTPTKYGPGYSMIRIWVGKEDFITRRVDFFDNSSANPFKRLIMENIYEEGGRKIPHKMTMRNLEDGTETVNIITKIRFGVNIPNSIFSPKNLGK